MIHYTISGCSITELHHIPERAGGRESWGGGGRVREKNARQKDEKECMGKIDGREKRGIGNI